MLKKLSAIQVTSRSFQRNLISSICDKPINLSCTSCMWRKGVEETRNRIMQLLMNISLKQNVFMSVIDRQLSSQRHYVKFSVGNTKSIKENYQYKKHLKVSFNSKSGSVNFIETERKTVQAVYIVG